MKYLKTFEDNIMSIEKSPFKKYLLTDFFKSNIRIFILQTTENSTPNNIVYDRYLFFDVDELVDTIPTTSTPNFENWSDNINILYQTDSEEESIKELKIYNTATKYNL